MVGLHCSHEVFDEDPPPFDELLMEDAELLEQEKAEKLLMEEEDAEMLEQEKAEKLLMEDAEPDLLNAGVEKFSSEKLLPPIGAPVTKGFFPLEEAPGGTQQIATPCSPAETEAEDHPKNELWELTQRKDRLKKQLRDLEKGEKAAVTAESKITSSSKMVDSSCQTAAPLSTAESSSSLAERARVSAAGPGGAASASGTAASSSAAGVSAGASTSVVTTGPSTGGPQEFSTKTLGRKTGPSVLVENCLTEVRQICSNLGQYTSARPRKRSPPRTRTST